MTDAATPSKHVADDIDLLSGSACCWVPEQRRVEKGASTVAYAYGQLRERILSGELGPGSALSEYQLAKTLSVSRTPVREALGRLQAAGLVRNIPQRGMFVRELGAEDVIEILEIREMLECLAVQRIVARGVPDATLADWEGQTDEAAGLVAEGRLSEAFALGCQLHDEIVSLAGNGRLTDILGQLGDQIRLLGLVGIRVPGRPAESVREHRQLIALLRGRDATGAVATMREHLQGEGQILLKALLPSASFATGF